MFFLLSHLWIWETERSKEEAVEKAKKDLIFPLLLLTIFIFLLYLFYRLVVCISIINFFVVNILYILMIVCINHKISERRVIWYFWPCRERSKEKKNRELTRRAWERQDHVKRNGGSLHRLERKERDDKPCNEHNNRSDTI